MQSLTVCLFYHLYNIKVLNRLDNGIDIINTVFHSCIMHNRSHDAKKLHFLHLEVWYTMRSVRNVNNYSKHDLATHTYLDLCFIYEHCYLKATTSSTVAIWYACTKVVSNSHDTSITFSLHLLLVLII